MRRLKEKGEMVGTTWEFLSQAVNLLTQNCTDRSRVAVESGLWSEADMGLGSCSAAYEVIWDNFDFRELQHSHL